MFSLTFVTFAVQLNHFTSIRFNHFIITVINEMIESYSIRILNKVIKSH